MADDCLSGSLIISDTLVCCILLVESGSDICFIMFCRHIHSGYLRNRKHVPCLYRVIEIQVEVWENTKCCGNTSHR